MDKAFTAAGHRVGTHTYKEAVWPGGVAYGLGNSIGGIGASTGTPAQDQQVVQAGVDALNEVLKSGSKLKAKL
jgi:uncharacterized protein GlcG (DUF336 family)